MKSSAFKISAIAAAALLSACGGSGSDSTVTPDTTPPEVPPVVPVVENALDAARAILTKYDALLATSIPATGAAFTALHDACYLSNGRSKAYIVADFDADPQQAVSANQASVGSTRSNVRVLAERNSTNADGSTRREIDIQYDITYKDGSKIVSSAAWGASETIISGSSAGATLADGTVCAAAENKTDWRFYGDRRIVRVAIGASNERIDRTVLSTGLPASPQVVYSKYLTLQVNDPAKVATYAIVTGPGLSVSVDGATGSLKLLSVRLLRTAPELAGKIGNAVDWRDSDGWRICNNDTRNNYEAAATADCVANGANANTWGFYNNVSGAALDTSFNAMNIKVGDVYTVSVYNDDGWKTVNGQAGKTPIATYTHTLRAVPFSAATLAGSGVTADLFARFITTSKTVAEIATAVRTKAAISVDATWSTPGAMPDGLVQQLGDTYVFEQGRANTEGKSWPRSRSIAFGYPGTQATSANFTLPVPVAALVVPTYASMNLEYNNRMGNNVLTTYALQ